MISNFIDICTCSSFSRLFFSTTKFIVQVIRKCVAVVLVRIFILLFPISPFPLFSFSFVGNVWNHNYVWFIPPITIIMSYNDLRKSIWISILYSQKKITILTRNVLLVDFNPELRIFKYWLKVIQINIKLILRMKRWINYIKKLQTYKI